MNTAGNLIPAVQKKSSFCLIFINEKIFIRKNSYLVRHITNGNCSPPCSGGSVTQNVMRNGTRCVDKI